MDTLSISNQQFQALKNMEPEKRRKLSLFRPTVVPSYELVEEPLDAQNA